LKFNNLGFFISRFGHFLVISFHEYH
jgi:hypothetical protein